MTAASALPAIELLYEKHRKQALSVARRILKDADDAEDVVQEVFSRLLVKDVQFDGRAETSTWLHRVLVNSSINSLRAKKRRGRLVTSPQAPEAADIALENDEQRAVIMRALEQMSEQHRTLLTLREFRGMAYADIASLLHIPEGTVKSALNRARRRLMELVPPGALNG